MNEELVRAQYKQLENLHELETRGETVGGWKLGLTSGGSRDAFGPGIRPFGFIPASRVLASGASVDWQQIGTGGIENEVCFVIAGDVTVPVTAASIRGHLGGVAPAFEINQRRIDKSSPPAERIADDLANWGIVVGQPVPLRSDWQGEELIVTLRHGNADVERVPAAGHIDDHFVTLATLANQLLEFGRHLQAGQRVITGAFGKQDQPATGTWSGDFGDELGSVELRVIND